jgi:hypothetical protein
MMTDASPSKRPKRQRWRPRKFRFELDPASAAAIGDRGWFAANPARRYRARDGVVIRRVHGAYLRAVDPWSDSDDELECEARWWAAAWPALPTKIRNRLRRAARELAR